MARELVPDALWERVQPLLPRPPARRRGGRPRADDRACLRGIIFVLKTGIQWEELPCEVFGVSGMTCWRRLRDWHAAGVFSALQRWLLDELGRAGCIDWSRFSVDSSSVRAFQKGAQTGPNPTDRAKAGSKHHLLVDQQGHPLAVALTAANVNDVGMLLPLVDAVPAIKRRRGRRRRPNKLHADKGYASQANRQGLRKRHITPRIARPRVDSSQGLGRHRWVVEQRLALLHRFRRLRVRDERRGDIHLALLVLGCDLQLFRALTKFC
ncbi:IS5 family transposase [Myxococcaceae bacterium GXIMD 01537]